MKISLTLKAFAFLISGLFMLSACNKDQKLISDIAGEYKIESITNYNKGQSSAVTLATAVIFFEDCTMKDGVGGNCTGWYEINGMSRVNFQYHTKKEKGSKTIIITNPTPPTEPVIRGYYEFKKEGQFMLLNGIQGSAEADNGVSYSDYSNIKLSKK